MALNSRNTSSLGIDTIAITLFVALLCIGWTMITAVTFSDKAADFSLYNAILNRESMWFGIALMAFIASLLIEYKFWNTLALPVYTFGILLLIGVLIFGREIKGATSWYIIGGFSFQPSEFAKWSTALMLANYCGLASVRLNNVRNIAIAAGIIALPMLVILMQPDAGSALVFTSLLFVLYRAGLSRPFFMGIFILMGVVIGTLKLGIFITMPLLLAIGSVILILQHQYQTILFAIWAVIVLALFAFRQSLSPVVLNGILALLLGGMAFYTIYKTKLAPVVVILSIVVTTLGLGWATHFGYTKILRPHQQDRINVWLHPDKCDPQGSLYNVMQSKTAIGSGGLMGKGFLNGTMTKLNYVPEQQTDFIFSTLGEEQGFLGVVGVILIFLILLIRITVIAERAKNDFIKYYAYGVAGILFFQVFINIGMTMGVMPVIGIPLPFISKGGTSLVVFSIMFGTLLRMDMDRNTR